MKQRFATSFAFLALLFFAACSNPVAWQGGGGLDGPGLSKWHHQGLAGETCPGGGAPNNDGECQPPSPGGHNNADGDGDKTKERY